LTRPEVPEVDEQPAALYLEKVRRLVGRLSSRDIGPGDVGQALAAVADVLPLDPDAPPASPTRAGRLARAVLKRALSWYLRYLSEQVNDLGFALLRAAEALAEALSLAGRTAEGKTEELARRLEDLEARLGQLEEQARPTGESQARRGG
jgi:ubiquinone biosynthesis protein UbiJ